MSIDDQYKIPIDASANVHSVSAVGEQYLDLVSKTMRRNSTSPPGQTITKSHGASRDRAGARRANRGLARCPRSKIA